jgi:DNA-binding MarR family transcriptional regulator
VIGDDGDAIRDADVIRDRDGQAGGGPLSPATRFSREQSTGYLAWRLARSFSRALDHRLAGYGVPVGQFRVLLILWETERLTQTQIARMLDLEQPTVAAMVGRMARDGLVTTAPDPADRRRVLISVTDAGRALQGPLTAEAQRLNEIATDGLAAAEVLRLHELLRSLGDRLGGDAQ